MSVAHLSYSAPYPRFYAEGDVFRDPDPYAKILGVDCPTHERTRGTCGIGNFCCKWPKLQMVGELRPLEALNLC